MRKAKQSVHVIQPKIRSNKNFVYNGKKFPIDFNLIIQNSNYFFTKQDYFNTINDIKLLDDIIKLNDSSIIAFISSCQNQEFEVTNDNVYPLYQLSIQYEVSELLQITTEYIKDNKEQLIFQSILYKIEAQNKESSIELMNDIQEDEKFIVSHFFKYVNNEKMLTLPINILFRIINDEKLNINQLNPKNQKIMIDFLFKCLDKYKKKASILFLNLDLEHQNIDIISRLLYNYSDIFDFGMINPKFLLQTTSDLLSELNKLKYDYSIKVKELNNLLESHKEYMEFQKQKEQDLLKSIQAIKDEKFKENIKIQKQKEQDLMQSIQTIIDDKIKKENEKWQKTYNEIKNNQLSYNKSLENKIKMIKNELNTSMKEQFAIESNKNKEFSILINQLKTQQKNQNDQIQNLMKQNDTSYITMDKLKILTLSFIEF